VSRLCQTGLLSGVACVFFFVLVVQVQLWRQGVWKMERLCPMQTCCLCLLLVQMRCLYLMFMCTALIC